MSTLAGWISILNLIGLVGVGIVGFFTVRSAITKSNQDTQARVREALHDENELLRSQMDRQDREIKRLERLMHLVMTTLKKTHGIELEIDGEIITLRSPNSTIRVVASEP